MNNDFQIILDPVTARATFKGKLPSAHVESPVSEADVAAINEAIALINQRLEEIEMALQNSINNINRVEYISVTGTTQALATNTGYIANNAAAAPVMTLPTTALVGTIIDIVGSAAGGWRIAQNANQSIWFGNKGSTAGTGGSLNSTHSKDSVRLLCVVADTTWTVLRAVGNLDII